MNKHKHADLTVAYAQKLLRNYEKNTTKSQISEQKIFFSRFPKYVPRILLEALLPPLKVSLISKRFPYVDWSTESPNIEKWLTAYACQLVEWN